MFLEDIQELLSEMKKELQPYGFKVKLIGGLHERGYTSNDIDLDINMAYSSPPEQEIFNILNQYGNEFWEKHHLELDINFFVKGNFTYKFSKEGFFEVQEDGSIEGSSI